MVECDRTEKIFTAPSEKLTEDYITGHGSARRRQAAAAHTMEPVERVAGHFQDELQQLKTRLLEMGGLAEEEVRLAVQGLVERDDALARARAEAATNR